MFALSHDTRQIRRDIMGQGFRNVRWNFADPPPPEKGGTFSEDNAADVKVRIVGANLDQRPATVTDAVDVADDRGLRAVHFYAPHQDSAVGGRWLKDKRQSFTQELAIEPSKSSEVQISVVVTDIGGNFAQVIATTGAKQ